MPSLACRPHHSTSRRVATAVKAAGGVAGVWEDVILGEKVYAFRVVENVFSVLTLVF